MERVIMSYHSDTGFLNFTELLTKISTALKEKLQTCFATTYAGSGVNIYSKNILKNLQ